MNTVNTNHNTAALQIIRGVSGSGKSTLAGKLSSQTPNSIVLEADMYFIDENGNYNYCRDRIRDAHAWCIAETEKYIQLGFTVFVANTFCREYEVKPYREIAKKSGCSLQITTCTGAYQNVHDVPCEIVEMQRARFEDIKA